MQKLCGNVPTHTPPLSEQVSGAGAQRGAVLAVQLWFDLVYLCTYIKVTANEQPGGSVLVVWKVLCTINGSVSLQLCFGVPQLYICLSVMF